MSRNAPDLEAAYSLNSPDANRSLYRDWAATYDEDFARRGGYRFPLLIAQAYIDAGGKWPALDVGCGTGLVAEYLPEDAVIDGVDIAPEMLAMARRKGRYRNLIEADLTQPLALPDAPYAGMISAGTFTHGHVGPGALDELMRVLKPGAICAITGNASFFAKAGFRETFDRLIAAGTICEPTLREERIYEANATPPEGHEDDMGYVIVFCRL